MENKAREFWIRWQEHWNKKLSHVITNVLMKDHGCSEDIHVIEYSAYEKLQKRIQVLESALKDVNVALMSVEFTASAKHFHLNRRNLSSLCLKKSKMIDQALGFTANKY